MDPAKDWGVGNPMNEFRNRRTDVTPQFLQQYAKHFKLPKDWNPSDVPERMRRFESYLWIGNMQHMRCYETALNFWRRLRSNSKCVVGVAVCRGCQRHNRKPGTAGGVVVQLSASPKHSKVPACIAGC